MMLKSAREAMAVASLSVLLFGCNARHSQLDDVSQAALRIKTSVEIGSYVPTSATLDAFAYEIAKANRLELDALDAQSMRYYETALRSYLGANAAWAAGDQFRHCEVQDPIPTARDLQEAIARCSARYREQIMSAAEMAHISTDEVQSAVPNAVLRRAASEIERAELTRHKR
jgi:hypothetical protein